MMGSYGKQYVWIDLIPDFILYILHSIFYILVSFPSNHLIPAQPYGAGAGIKDDRYF